MDPHRPTEPTPLSPPPGRFAFGRNWREFSIRCLDPRAFAAARVSLEELLVRYPGDRESFLDIGCGSGLFLAAARDLGFQRCCGFDYDPECVATTRENLHRLADQAADSVEVSEGDVLDEAFLQRLGLFSVVYAWGSLHHTGAMWQALALSAARVAPGGLLIVAIYNRTLTSPIWRGIKRLYVVSPVWLRHLLVGAVWVAGAIARAIYIRGNPFPKERGMNFYYNIVDWVGGYPYEYASIPEVITFLTGQGLTLEGVKKGQTPIACNEFAFRRLPAATGR